MFHIFCGCPFLSLLFSVSIVWALCMEHRQMTRQQVQGSSYWYIMLFGLWLMFVPAFAVLWLVSSARGPHGVIPFWSVQSVFLACASAHNFLLKPVFRNYKKTVVNRSFNSIWVR